MYQAKFWKLQVFSGLFLQWIDFFLWNKTLEMSLYWICFRIHWKCMQKQPQLQHLIQGVFASSSIKSLKYLLNDSDVSLLCDELCCKFTFQPVWNYQFSSPVSNMRLVCSSLLNDFRNTLKCITRSVLILYKSCLPWRNTGNKKRKYWQ